jgi:hypothetical protein
VLLNSGRLVRIIESGKPPLVASTKYGELGCAKPFDRLTSSMICELLVSCAMLPKAFCLRARFLGIVSCFDAGLKGGGDIAWRPCVYAIALSALIACDTVA